MNAQLEDVLAGAVAETRFWEAHRPDSPKDSVRTAQLASRSSRGQRTARRRRDNSACPTTCHPGTGAIALPTLRRAHDCYSSIRTRLTMFTMRPGLLPIAPPTQSRGRATRTSVPRCGPLQVAVLLSPNFGTGFRPLTRKGPIMTGCRRVPTTRPPWLPPTPGSFSRWPERPGWVRSAANPSGSLLVSLLKMSRRSEAALRPLQFSGRDISDQG